MWKEAIFMIIVSLITVFFIDMAISGNGNGMLNGELNEIITITPSTETHCNVENGRKQCWIALYSGVRYWQNKSGDWVNPSELFRITKNQDDLTFHYDGLEGYYNLTFETGIIYNSNYYPMQQVKQLYPTIQFNFPTKKLPANWKYAVNITNIPLNKSKIQDITLTYKSHYGFIIDELKSEKKKYLIKDIFELIFDDLIERNFIVNINKTERRIYISNITLDKFEGNSLYLDPTIKLQVANTENLDDTYVRLDLPDFSIGANNNMYVTGSTGRGRVYIKFNISSIPVGQTIDNAELYLYHYIGNHIYQPNISAFHFYNHSWEEGITADSQLFPNITWNNQPCGVNFDISTQCNLTAENVESNFSSTGLWRNWTVTNMVKNEYENGDKNVSIVLVQTPETSSYATITFYTKEYTTDTTKRPYLNITYSEAGDTTPPSFSNNQTNASSTTYNGTTVQINLTITDSGGIDYYRLTINDTQDNTWDNKTIYDGNDATSVTAIFNYTIMNISSNGGTLGWQVWANDTAGNVNVSQIYTFVVQSIFEEEVTIYYWDLIDNDNTLGKQLIKTGGRI